MKKINIILQTVAIAGFLSLIFGCNELPFAQTPTDKTPPPPVTNVEAISIPGGAKITYELPVSDDDISYVKAEYNQNGKLWTVRTSIYSDTLIIEGLGSIEPITATLYVVDHSENTSSGVSVNFTPETPPIQTIFESVKLLPDFGGVKVLWTNDTNTEVGITIFIEDASGIMRAENTRFSRERLGEVTFRGYESKEYHFAALIIDKWGHESEKKEAYLTPLYEKLLDKSKFKEAALPGDNVSTNANRPLPLTWDNNKSTFWHAEYINSPYEFPMYFTIDLGVTAHLSRFKYWNRINHYFDNFGLKTFEVWGAKECKPGMSDAYWTGSEWKNDWEKLGDFELKRPSGATEEIGRPTGIDLEAAESGHEYYIPIDSQDLQYVRFVVKTVWSPGNAIVMAEIEIYGDDTVKQ
jgi:hypothetical protein